MPMLADLVDVVVGVDTHKHTHTAAVVASSGAVLAIETVNADPAGYQRIRELAITHGVRRCFAIEGTATYGAGLTRFLQGAHEPTVEIDSPNRPKRRGGRKNDEIDALRCARHALAAEHRAVPRVGAQRDALAAVLAVRAGAVDASAAAQNQLQSLLVTAPDPIREQLRSASTAPRRWAACAALDPDTGADLLTKTTIAVLRAAAQRIIALEDEIRAHTTRLTELVRGWRGDLLDVFGVGPIAAAVVLCAWAGPGRFRNDAAFVMLAGAAPVPASSGQTVRHRLNRGGDRQLNRALHVIAQTRLRLDPTTRAYAERRRAEGKTPAEIRRCLKRYIARQLIRQLENPPTTP